MSTTMKTASDAPVIPAAVPRSCVNWETKSAIAPKTAHIRTRFRPNSSASTRLNSPLNFTPPRYDIRPMTTPIARTAVLLAAQHAAAGQQRPDGDQEDEDPDLERGVAADGPRRHRVAGPLELLCQLRKLRPCRGGVDQRGHAGHRGDDRQAHPDAPAEDGDSVIAQRL